MLVMVFRLSLGVWQGNENEVTLFNVYGPHDDFARRRLWGDLLEVLHSTGSQNCLMRDFNVVRNQDGRKGSFFYQQRANAFNDFIHTAGLTELKMGGRSFTWIGMGGTK